MDLGFHSKSVFGGSFKVSTEFFFFVGICFTWNKEKVSIVSIENGVLLDRDVCRSNALGGRRTVQVSVFLPITPFS